ncbi:hypothetical protein [Mycetocola sp. JXN-3]|uniref:hypothetical protein n=1 Tax=Mycetocola sp. JXN-3 TaxID=2116510 RepID=UPI00165CED71|nr:hypothetical protein [Mycetocola sp. JXN-3]
MTESGPTSDPAAPASPPSRFRLLIIIAVVALLVVVVGVTLVLRGASGTKDSARPKATAAQGPSASPLTEPSATPESVNSAEPAPTTAAIELPASCQAIYSGPMFSSLRALELPLNDPSLADETGTAIPELDTLLRANPGLHCSWGLPSELGINTNVTLIDPAAAQNIEAALVARGATCEDKDDGTLCTLIHVGPGVEGWAEGDPQAGENHFFRDNAWIATHWSTVEMNGYTPDIVHTLWP